RTASTGVSSSPGTILTLAMGLCFIIATGCLTPLVAAITSLSARTDVGLQALASSISAAREEARVDGRTQPQQRQRLSLQHLEAMWHTSLGVQLDDSSSLREEAYRSIVDFQWALLASQDDANQTQQSSSLAGQTSESDSLTPLSRSPFLVCGDRHPDAVLAVESVVHRARTQLVYSRGDTVCLLAGLRLDEVDTVLRSETVHVVEPLPQPAKLSQSLHAKLDEPPKSPVGVANNDSFSPSNGNSGDGGEIRKRVLTAAATERAGGVPSPAAQHTESGETAISDNDSQQGQQQRRVRFNHGEGLPSDLDVSLTPGTWGLDMAHTWVEHLISFESTAHLWGEHLRDRFVWTHNSPVDDDEGAVREGAEDSDGKERRGLNVDEAPTSQTRLHRTRNTLIGSHGLTDLGNLWEQTVDHSSKDGACDFRRLGALAAPEESSNAGSNTKDSKEGAGPHGATRRRRERRPGPSQKDPVGKKRTEGGANDRVVLRGAGSLGNTPEDNAHCLLTVLAYLVTRPEVSYVDDLPQVFELNVEAAWITQSGEETAYSMWNEGIDGSTEIIAMADSGLDVNSCFFTEDHTVDNIDCSSWSNPVFDLTKRKIVQYVGFVDCVDTENGHGTHVAGSAAGGLSNSSPGEHFGDGAGFGAKLAVFDFGDSDGGLSQMLQPPYDIGARISTNSWGAVRTTYTSLDRQVDDFAYLNQDMVIVVAAGNCGDEISGCQYQNADIYGSGSILSPALGKNVISVGASEASPSTAGLADNVDEVAYFSSQGPTVDDNRIKPDVVAPGYHLFSASAKPDQESSCEIGPMAGTSMATPVVAGAAAMIRQYFVQGWYPSGIATPSNIFNPSNALIKAMIVTSGTAMASYDNSAGSTTLGSPPDAIQGFGRVLLDSVLNVRGSVDLFVEDWVDMAHGDVNSHLIEMDGVSSSAFDGDMKVRETRGA
ncbi:unnamed protein product, partial [Ectocarpus sp. 13 AM-2016]